MDFVKINKKNLSKYYWETNGNLYYKYPEDKFFQVLVGFDEEECECALNNKVKFIWIEGEGPDRPFILNEKSKTIKLLDDGAPEFIGSSWSIA